MTGPRANTAASNHTVSKRYLTTTLPYINAEPHLGFALELVQADVVARAERLAGKQVFLNTGTDEHGLKIWRRAAEEGLSPQEYANQASAKFRALLPALGVGEETNFIRTTDPAHVAAAQEFWLRASAAGDIYKKNYRAKYCVGCELEKTDSELVEGRCSLHPNQELETVEEENYFFRFSKYQAPLLKLYEAGFVLPSVRLNEIRAFVERGLEDFSISRLAAKMPWGVPVPNDPTQVMYVWFDALVSYISALGWPQAEKKFEEFWVGGDPLQFAGKDNLRQQAAMWPAMLLSAGLPPARQIVIHGFITNDGQKMSKSLGNVINPLELVEEYGSEALRYFLLRHVHPFEDSDVTAAKFKEVYNSHLANGLGNLLSRVIKMAAEFEVPPVETVATIDPAVLNYLTRFEFGLALDFIWRQVSELNGLIQETQPFKTIKTEPERARADVAALLAGLAALAANLVPALPATAAALTRALQTHHLPAPLFPRKD